MDLISIALLVWSLISFNVCSSGGSNVPGVALNNTLTLGYFMSWEVWKIGRVAASAIIPALEEVGRRGLLPGYEIEWIMGSTDCTEAKAMPEAVKMWQSTPDLDAIIGEGCSTVCNNQALLAAAWQIPIISWGCASTIFWDKGTFPTFMRTVGPWSGFSTMFDKLADRFGWSKMAIVTTREDVFVETAIAIKEEMEQHNKAIIYRTVPTVMTGDIIHQEELTRQQQVIRELRDTTRVIVILAYPGDARLALLTLYDLGMLDGDYIIIGWELQPLLGSVQTYRPEMDQLLYNGLVTITYRKGGGPGYEEFARQVVSSFSDPRFDGHDHLPPDTDPDQVDVYAGMYLITVVIHEFDLILPVCQFTFIASVFLIA